MARLDSDGPRSAEPSGNVINLHDLLASHDQRSAAPGPRISKTWMIGGLVGLSLAAGLMIASNGAPDVAASPSPQKREPGETGALERLYDLSLRSSRAVLVRIGASMSDQNEASLAALATPAQFDLLPIPEFEPGLPEENLRALELPMEVEPKNGVAPSRFVTNEVFGETAKIKFSSLKPEAARDSRTRESARPVRQIAQSAVYPAVTETPIDLKQDAGIRAVLNANVLEKGTNKVLVPRSSKALGSYHVEKDGAARIVKITWHRFMNEQGAEIFAPSAGSSITSRIELKGEHVNLKTSRISLGEPIRIAVSE